MLDHLNTLQSIVDNMTRTCGLPTPTKGFDGDSWVWIWRAPRERIDDPTKSTFAEVQVRVRPDDLGEGIDTEVSASAWHAAGAHWSRPYFRRYWQADMVKYKSGFISDELETAVRQAWQDAWVNADRLPEIESRQQRERQQVIDKLPKGMYSR